MTDTQCIAILAAIFRAMDKKTSRSNEGSESDYVAMASSFLLEAKRREPTFAQILTKIKESPI